MLEQVGTVGDWVTGTPRLFKLIQLPKYSNLKTLLESSKKPLNDILLQDVMDASHLGISAVLVKDVRGSKLHEFDVLNVL